MAEIDFSLLDVPRTVPVVDPEAYLRAAVAWHFGQDTGSPFWLRMAPNLDFDPLTDVNGFDDLRLFPNLVNELRDTPVQDLIPRGYGSPAPVPKIFESGGTPARPNAPRSCRTGLSRSPGGSWRISRQVASWAARGCCS
ncbi:Uncharacterised protein [Mycobacteroides abscessus]|nr:Uncharacterised protein [Mycobacteroides abscessus]